MDRLFHVLSCQRWFFGNYDKCNYNILVMRIRYLRPVCSKTWHHVKNVLRKISLIIYEIEFVSLRVKIYIPTHSATVLTQITFLIKLKRLIFAPTNYLPLDIKPWPAETLTNISIIKSIYTLNYNSTTVKSVYRHNHI